MGVRDRYLVGNFRREMRMMVVLKGSKVHWPPKRKRSQTTSKSITGVMNREPN